VIEHVAGDVDARDVRSLYIRRDFVGPGLADDVDLQGYMKLQTAIHLHSWLRWMSLQCPSMNDPMANLRLMSKMVQGTFAGTCGFDLPDTFSGTSSTIASKFQQVAKKPLCIKPIEATRVRLSDGSRAAHLTRRTNDLSQEDLNTLTECPAVLQEYLEKRDELRITVVGREIHACRIDTSKASAKAQEDFRHYDWANTEYHAESLADSFAGRLRKFMKISGLSYGAFDFVRSKDDRTVFLEVNPMGQWLWIEDLSGLPITKSIARWLSVPES